MLQVWINIWICMSHSQFLNTIILKFNSLVLLNLLSNIFSYCPSVGEIRRINSSSIDPQGWSMELQLRMSVLWLESGNTMKYTLRLFFIIYPCYCPNTDTIYLVKFQVVSSLEPYLFDTMKICPQIKVVIYSYADSMSPSFPPLALRRRQAYTASSHKKRLCCT